MTDDPQRGTEVERTGLAWSRTLIAFSAVLGLMGVRAAVFDAPLYAIIPVLAVSAGVLLTSGVVTIRSLNRARHEMTTSTRVNRAAAPFAAAAAATILALASLGIVLVGAPPS